MADVETIEIDTGPLTEAQLRGLARDCISQLRSVADSLWEEHRVPMDYWYLDRIEQQLCGKGTDDDGAGC